MSYKYFPMAKLILYFISERIMLTLLWWSISLLIQWDGNKRKWDNTADVTKKYEPSVRSRDSHTSALFICHVTRPRFLCYYFSLYSKHFRLARSTSIRTLSFYNLLFTINFAQQINFMWQIKMFTKFTFWLSKQMNYFL